MNVKYGENGERLTPYKEDSTKGGAMILPLNYKGDINLQCWIDSRVLATLAMWLEKNGFYCRSLSEVGKRPLEILVEMLTSSGQAEIVDDTNNARALLSHRFRISNGPNEGKGQRNVKHNQVLSSNRRDLAEYVKRGEEVIATRPAVISQDEIMSNELVKQAYAEYEKQHGPILNKQVVQPRAIESEEDIQKLSKSILDRERDEVEYQRRLNSPIPDSVKERLLVKEEKDESKD